VKSSVETLSPTRVKLSIEVSFEDLDQYIKGAYKTLSEKISIPGFRKGKVPQAMIDQRVGRAAVLDEAINSSLSPMYAAALKEQNVFVIGRPTIDITKLVDNEMFSFTAEVDIRPELKLPDFSKITLTVEDVVVSDAEVAEQVDLLRARFGTLSTVEKSVENGDFVSIDLVATIDGKEVEGGTANDISYEVGTNRMVDGLDEALAGLSAGESKKFDTQLVGQKDDEKGSVEVTVKSVKHRDLPELNDEFAKLASEFETLAELRADVQTRLERVKHLEQGAHARDLLVEKLIKDVEIPLPQNVIDDEVNDHLEKEGRLEDETHRKEVIEEVTKSLTQEILFDNIVQAESVSVNESELTEYLVRASQRYGMTPDQFIKEVSEAGQITTMVAEVSRAKALAGVLSRVKVVTTSGKEVNLEELAPKQAAPASDAADSAE
jgi:trigger factor